MKNLVGKTVRISPQDKTKGGNKTRTVEILQEYYDESNVRMYKARDAEVKEEFSANADTYDKLFLTGYKPILPKHTRDVIYKASNANYKN